MPASKTTVNLGSLAFDEWPDLLKPVEVATLFRVDPKTVKRWVLDKKIPESEVTETLGGHRRYRKQFIYDMYLAGQNKL